MAASLGGTLSVAMATVAACAWLAPAPIASAAAEPVSAPFTVGLSQPLMPTALIGAMTTAEKIAQLQDAAPAVPRLGLAAYSWWNEGLHGLARAGAATVFPQAIGLAASWDVPLLRQIGSVIAIEARERYDAPPGDDAARSRNAARYRGLTIWSPNINLFRDPRWGRGQETYGEDPVLTARLGVAFIGGLQGDDPARPTAIATPKHFAVHSGPERGRHGFNVDPSPFDLEDSYLPAFRAAVTEGRAGSIMCAYNGLGGTPACANSWLLQSLLRGDWGFTGFVVSDCDAVEDMTLFHKTTLDDAEASARALRASTDLNCGRSYAALGEALRRGLVDEKDLDRALARLLDARARLGALTPLAGASPMAAAATAPANAAERRALALAAARESIVLLKNAGATKNAGANRKSAGAKRTGADESGSILPLKRGTRVAVIGPTADLIEDLEASYHGTARDPVTPLDGMQRQFGAARTRYAQGSALAVGVPIAVPRSALRTPDGRPGLRAEVFDEEHFDGKPAVVQTVPKLNLDDDRIAPVPGVRPERFAIRWSGQLVAPAPGEYQLGVRVDRCFDCGAHDRVRLELDGRVLSDGREDARAAAVHFDDRRPHALKVELIHDGEDHGLTLQWLAPASAQLAEAVAAARLADVTVAFVGLSPNLEGEQLRLDVPGFDGGDRTSLDLPATQETLLKALKATGKPLVVVLQSGGAVALNWAAAHADAVVAAWYPGEAGGQAIADVLAGVVNPAGRLPVTFYRDVAELPSFDDYRMRGRGYRYFTGAPLWPFGHGLSYTRFEYAEPRLGAEALRAGEPLPVEVEIHNAGLRDGDEVVQFYLEPPRPSSDGSPRAPHALAAFRRIHLRAGERRRVALSLDARALSLADAQGRRAVEPGRYRLAVGGGQPGFAPVRRVAFTIEGRRELPK